MSTHQEKLFTYLHPHPAVATDIAVFGLTPDDARLNLLLIERGEEPFRGAWALPGGFLTPDETLDACARRELQEETGVADAPLHHFGLFSAPDRDPRERVISVAYLALVRPDTVSVAAGSDAATARWFPVDALPPLAFDHDRIIAAAHEALRRRADDTAFLLALLPPRFTFARLQTLYETVTSQPADKRNFRARVLASGVLRETEETERGAHRPARLFERA